MDSNYCIECYSPEGSVDIATGLKPEITKWIQGQSRPYPFGLLGQDNGVAKPASIVVWDCKSQGTHFLCKSCVSLVSDDYHEAINAWAIARGEAEMDMTGQDQEAILGWSRS